MMPNNFSPLISKLRELSRQGTLNQPQKKGRDTEKSHGIEGTERCDFCSKPIPSDHPHFADLNNMKFMCACEVCAVLQAERGEYHPIPQRYQYLEDFKMPEEIWTQLKIPVNMAFIVYNSDQERPIAFYPSPAGSMESELQLDSWEELKENSPALQRLAPDLEGFMINRLDKPYEHFIVPIDCCYELIGLIRMSWQGIHGGEEMQNSVRKFFKELKQKSG